MSPKRLLDAGFKIMLVSMLVGVGLFVGWFVTVDIGESAVHADEYERMCNDQFGIEWQYEGTSTLPWSDHYEVRCTKHYDGGWDSTTETVKVPKEGSK